MPITFKGQIPVVNNPPKITSSNQLMELADIDKIIFSLNSEERQFITKEVALRLLSKTSNPNDVASKLQCIPSQVIDEDVAMMAVKLYNKADRQQQIDASILFHIPKKTRNRAICLEAIKASPAAFNYIPKDVIDEQIAKISVEWSAHFIESIPTHLLTTEICSLAIKESPDLIGVLPVEFQSEGMIKLALSIDPSSIEFVDESKITNEIVKYAVDLSPGAILYVPENALKPEFLTEFLSEHPEFMLSLKNKALTDSVIVSVLEADIRNLAYLPVQCMKGEILENVRDQIATFAQNWDQFKDLQIECISRIVEWDNNMLACVEDLPMFMRIANKLNIEVVIPEATHAETPAPG